MWKIKRKVIPSITATLGTMTSEFKKWLSVSRNNIKDRHIEERAIRDR